MKILLPTAKELNENLDGLPVGRLNPRTQSVVNQLLQMDVEQLAEFYGIQPKQAQREYRRLKNIQEGRAITLPAYKMFDGLMYRSMNRYQLSNEELDYLSNHAFITSALYGVINFFDLICPYRLDFANRLSVQNQSLKAYWRPFYAEAVTSDELIISLLSEEFETVFPAEIRKKMVKLVFKEERAGRLVSHSTISKKARGYFLSAMAAHQAKTLADVKVITVEGYAYREELSAANQLVFVKKVD